MMRCEKCRKNFDEEMYSGVCPNCGFFNNRQTEYDVSKYFSTKFDDSGKVSTSEQAAKQHEKLHNMYDDHDMHKQQGSHHEKLHEIYDKYNMHRPVSNNQTGGVPGRANPYQQIPVQGKTNMSGRANPYQQIPVQGKTNMSGRTNPYQQIPVQGKTNTSMTGQPLPYQQKQYSQANLNGETKKKNIVTPVCIVIALLAVAITVVCCHLKEQSMEKAYYTLEFEQETAQPGELFEVYDRLFMVDKAKVVDTSALEDMPKGEKLVAVTVELLPADGSGGNDISGEVYVSDGSSYKLPLYDYTVMDILYDGDYSMRDSIFPGYSFQGNIYIRSDGKTGDFYFFVDENADEISITFEDGFEKDGIYVVQRRVSIPLQLEEDGI